MLHGLSLHELRLLRNEVYARHGRMFRAEWLQQYFFFQPWYAPDENFKDEELSGNDKLNVETIVKYENQIHQELSTKPITRALLDGLFLEDASQMRQEIYARHGKLFKEPWLQKYFSSFDWYKADPNFSDALLSEVEKKNIATIAAYEKSAVTEYDRGLIRPTQASRDEARTTDFTETKTRMNTDQSAFIRVYLWL
jgi:hypothetical protein